MADPTGVNPTGPIHNAGAAAPASTSGTFGRYTVVIGKAEGAQAQAATREVGLLSRNVSLWDRIVNRVTGSLDREKNAALIGFIKTGEASARGGGPGGASGAPSERVRAANYILSGNSRATAEEKTQAMEALAGAMQSDLSKWDIKSEGASKWVGGAKAFEEALLPDNIGNTDEDTRAAERSNSLKEANKEFFEWHGALSSSPATSSEMWEAFRSEIDRSVSSKIKEAYDKGDIEGIKTIKSMVAGIRAELRSDIYGIPDAAGNYRPGVLDQLESHWILSLNPEELQAHRTMDKFLGQTPAVLEEAEKSDKPEDKASIGHRKQLVQVHNFRDTLLGRTGATTEQKLEACRAFESVVTSERQRAASNPGSNTVSLLKQVLELMPKSMEPGLQQKVDELKRSLNPKPPRNEAVNGFVNEGGHVMSVPVPPTPLANALDKLTGKIKISGGGEHPVIKEMRDSLAAGTQPVVLLQKLEKMYNSSSVKYNPENKQAVREAAKEIYDGAIHGKPIQSTEQLRVVDALVGLGFEGIDAMRLSYDQDPVQL